MRASEKPLLSAIVRASSSDSSKSSTAQHAAWLKQAVRIADEAAEQLETVRSPIECQARFVIIHLSSERVDHLRRNIGGFETITSNDPLLSGSTIAAARRSLSRTLTRSAAL